ncbi:MAG: bacteriohemerythrin [Proteobacteria bacterium]|nr:bacteriohemerythrin [Pseudomonadota bacterium]
MQIEPEQNTLNPHNELFDIFECLDSVYDKFYPSAKEKGIELQLIHKKLPIVLIGDQGAIKQVLAHFSNNAINFTEKGIVKISVDIEELTDTKVTLKFSVTDTGIGIPENQQGNVFKTFAQIKAISKTHPTGTGLFISKYLAESMKGKIGFSSEEGEGSTFWFTTTLSVASIKETSSIIFKHDVTTLPEFKASILLAEDSKINSFIISKTLERLGCNVDIAENGQEALEKALNTKYDLIFMDYLMPVMDGLEATRLIREKENANQNIIIALTGGVSEKDKENGTKAGMDDFLYKPVTALSLVPVFDNFIPQLKTKAANYNTDDEIIPWTDKFSVGIPSIDNQHKNLFRYINMLHKAMIQKRSKEILDQTLQNLLTYTDVHFAYEEKYFEQFNYEYTDEHCEQHKYLKEKIKDFIKKYKSDKEDITENLFNFLKRWLIEHIMIEDAQYIDCFKKNGL